MRAKAILAGIAAAVLSSTLGAPAARADLVWTVDATFQDGATVTGTFSINVYGYLDAANLTTSPAGVFPGFTYTLGDSFISTGVHAGNYFVDFQPGYTADLHLQFADSLSVPNLNNVILGAGIGPSGPSYECQGSFGCYVPVGGDIRYVGSGFASAVPEPATWAMMVLGFVGLGFMAYRGNGRRRRSNFRFA